MNYITFKNLGEIGNTCSQIQQYASLLGIAKKTNKEIVFPESSLKLGYTFKFLNLLDIKLKIIPDDSINFKNVHINTDIQIDNSIYSLLDGENYSLCDRFDSHLYWYDIVGTEMFNIKFKSDVFDTSKKLINDIKINNKNKQLVSIHVRRGDYLLPQHDVLNKLNTKYYTDAILQYFPQINDYTFLIFSDDIDYCEHNIIRGDNIIYIKDNSDYVDMCMMSLCEHNIIANSSFSWWAAYMNKNKNKIVVCPNNYLNRNFNNTLNGNYFLKTWNAIDNN